MHQGRKIAIQDRRLRSAAVWQVTVQKADYKMAAEPEAPMSGAGPLTSGEKACQGSQETSKMGLSIAKGLAFHILGMRQKVKHYQPGTKSALQSGKCIFFGNATQKT